MVNTITFIGHGEKMKKLLLALPFSVLITACGAPSVDDLKIHPDLLRKANIECRRLVEKGESTDTEKCNNAKLAAEELSTYVHRVR